VSDSREELLEILNDHAGMSLEIANGVPLMWLAKALGHSSVSVTQTYLKNILGIDPMAIEGRDFKE